ncbi:hypothetical protein Gotur_005563 [Gossypium turneri]
MDVLAKQSQPSKPNQDDSTFSKKKKKTSDVNEQISSTSLIDDVMLLRENIRTVGLELSRSIVSEMDEYFLVLRKIPDYPTQMLVFLSLPSFVRLE